MPKITEARFWESLENRKVHCQLCPHDCKIDDGGHGVCGVRINRRGKLYTLVYNKVVARHIDPIEKKPLFHFQPGSESFSIGTVGCNLRCEFCQNWQISQWPNQNLPAKVNWGKEDTSTDIVCPIMEELAENIPGAEVTPESLVKSALSAGASSIAYTYTEPTIFYELAYDTAKLAGEAGLKNIFVTGGYIHQEPIHQLSEVLDAANIDLKFFKNESYQRMSKVKLQPILDAIRTYHDLGIWVEVTTLVIPGVNDSPTELRQIAEFIASVGVDIPWHISRFFPAHRLMDRPPTPIATLQLAQRIGKETGLRYIYTGNCPGEGGEDTICPGCGATLIKRFGFTLHKNRIRNGCCPDCGQKIDGIAMDSRNES